VAPSEPLGAGAIALEQLVALNDEIAALVRTGIPLERALGLLGEDMPGRLGKITRRLAERLQRGESLSEALGAEGEQFPPVYRAVVLAGLRSGRLGAALESVSHSARRLADTRRMVAAGFLYPIFVVLVAWGLFAMFVVCVVPTLAGFLADYDVIGRRLLGYLEGWGESAHIWGPWGAAAIVVPAILWWFLSGRATLLEAASAGRLLGWLPWLGPMLRWHRLAILAEVLALLVENRVPLGDGLVLSAEATGDPQMIRVAKKAAEALEQGQTLESLAGPTEECSPLLSWLMVVGHRRGALLPALRHAAEIYRGKTRRKADAARVFLPVLLSVAIGGTVTAVYALLLFAPWTRALRAMSGV
jgi:type II secretory pathway component PulF